MLLCHLKRDGVVASLELSQRAAPSLLQPGSVRVVLQRGEYDIWNPAEDPDEADRVLDILMGGHGRIPSEDDVAPADRVAEADEERGNDDDDDEDDDVIAVWEEREPLPPAQRGDNQGHEDVAVPVDEATRDLFDLLEQARGLDVEPTSSSSSSSTSSENNGESSDTSSSESNSGEPAAEVAEVAAELPVPPPPGVQVVRAAALEQADQRVRREFLVVYSGHEATEFLIRHKPQTQDYYVSCYCHRGCTRTRTLKPGRRPQQGRPLGELAAWALAGAACQTKEAHQALIPDFTARQQARRALRDHSPGYAQWTELERGTRADEGSEPE